MRLEQENKETKKVDILEMDELYFQYYSPSI
jgi:hypothetical protein